MWADKLQKCALLGGSLCNDEICNRADCLAGHWPVRFQPPSCLQPSKKATAGPVRGELVSPPSMLCTCPAQVTVAELLPSFGDCFYATVISCQLRRGHNPITRLLKVLAFFFSSSPPPPTTHHYHIQSGGSPVFSSITGLTQEARLTLICMGSPEIAII